MRGSLRGHSEELICGGRHEAVVGSEGFVRRQAERAGGRREGEAPLVGAERQGGSSSGGGRGEREREREHRRLERVEARARDGGAAAAAELAAGAADVDVLAGRVDHPVGALAGVVERARHLHEALVHCAHAHANANAHADRATGSLLLHTD